MLSQVGEIAVFIEHGITKDEDGKFCVHLNGERQACYDTREEAESKLQEAGKMSTQAKNGEQDAPEVEALKAGLAAANLRIATMEETRRKEKVAGKVASVKIPAWRPHLQAIYDALTASERPKTLKFALDGKTLSDAAPEAIVDALIADLNVKAERLFGETATSQLLREEGSAPKTREEAGAEVQARIDKFAVEKNVDISELAGWQKVRDAVLKADPELAALYAQ